jgi:hypothetical protein
MPLERVLVLIQIGLTPAALVSGLMLFGAWRARRWRLLTFLLGAYTLSAGFAALLACGVIDARRVAGVLPTNLLIWRLAGSGAERLTHEERALLPRVREGRLSRGELSWLLVYAADPANQRAFIGPLLEAALTEASVRSEQGDALGAWLSTAPDQIGQHLLAGAVLRRPHLDLSLNPELAGSIARSMLAKVMAGADATSMLGHGVLARLLFAGALSPEQIDEWGQTMLRMDAEPEAGTSAAARVRISGTPWGAVWTVRVVEPADAGRVAGTEVRVVLTPEPDRPGAASARITIEASLDPEAIAKQLLVNPGARPTGFRRSNVPAVTVRRSYVLSRHVSSSDAGTPGTIKVTPVEPGAGTR